MPVRLKLLDCGFAGRGAPGLLSERPQPLGALRREGGVSRMKPREAQGRPSSGLSQEHGAALGDFLEERTSS